MIGIVIDGVPIPAMAALDLRQDYEGIGGGPSIFRASDGTGIIQETWKKLRVTTSGKGWIPSALDGLDTSVSHVMGCIKQLSLPCTGLVATLPAARRSDAGAEPYGLAILSNGRTVKTPVTLAGNVATAAAVAGAVRYQVCWYPELVVGFERPTESLDRGDASFAWTLTAEEL